MNNIDYQNTEYTIKTDYYKKLFEKKRNKDGTMYADDLIELIEKSNCDEKFILYILNECIADFVKYSLKQQLNQQEKE